MTSARSGDRGGDRGGYIIELLPSAPIRFTVDRLGPLVGLQGAYGKVCSVPGHPDLAVKILHDPDGQRLADRLEALLYRWPAEVIVRDGRARVAWPRGRVLRASDETLVGFAMDLFGPPVHEQLADVFLAGRRVSAASAPERRTAVRLAADLAETVARIHRDQHVIGDLAPPNLLVDVAGGIVVVVDVDGWQLRDHSGERIPCPSAREGYTPPEHLTDPLPWNGSGSTETVIRNQMSDRWSLAVVATQILLLGIHPFAGTAVDLAPYEPVDERANVETQQCWVLGGAVHPPPGAPSPGVLPTEIRDLIRRCFADGYDQPRLRPPAAEWAGVLRSAVY
ncbi:hypothetical protein [Frankia sp. Cj3]|uniref:hypothetical protein n=1 Tax=Frankia sp. Cj3 TaxID=2880976 RepID=UPI001EF61231|nr:hypothetical protein [Frankia sp. Cj3]